MADDSDAKPGFVMDRELQKGLLLKMREVFPRRIYGYPGDRDISDQAINTLLYLRGHGLCEASITLVGKTGISFSGAEITERGLDFLEEDGGLSAILGVVTVKLHAETVRQLIEAKIDHADLPEEEKSRLRKHLASLSQTALQAGTSDLVRVGLDHLPNAMHWLRTLGGL